MVVDRMGTVLFAVGIVGIAWMAGSGPVAGSDRSVARQKPSGANAAALEAPPITSTFGEPMRGPFDSLDMVCNGCELNVKVMKGVAPFEELTVIVFGHEHDPPDLGDFAPTELAVRIKSKWYFKTLGKDGVACGGMGSPIWSDIKAEAPRFVQTSHSHGNEVSVRIVEHHSSGNTTRTFEAQVVCGLDDNGVPACATDQLAGYETTHSTE
ncbi:MAG TPA: hypothetical protein VFQ53_31300 [Kofleriaceae bacterium]|nr:hypothetical protein [Kofleriaceae bacterium]